VGEWEMNGVADLAGVGDNDILGGLVTVAFRNILYVHR
jgi:hypothetical protein